MKMTTLIALALATTPFVATPAAAETSEFYASVGDWNIYQGSDQCYMIAHYNPDTTLTVFARSWQDIDVWLQNKAWRSIQNGSDHTVSVEFDSLGAWSIKAVGNSDSDGPGLLWSANITENSDGDSYLAEFAVAKAMRVYRNGKLIEALSLDGTYAGSLKMLECLGQLQSEGDPFADDPFATSAEDNGNQIGLTRASF